MSMLKGTISININRTSAICNREKMSNMYYNFYEILLLEVLQQLQFQNNNKK